VFAIAADDDGDDDKKAVPLQETTQCKPVRSRALGVKLARLILRSISCYHAYG